MTLDPQQSDAELIRIASERQQRLGLKVIADPRVPPGTIVVADAKELGRIVGLPIGPMPPNGPRIHKPKAMNKTEAWRDRQLAGFQRQGVVRWYGFEAITLKLANGLRYTPDFTVLYDLNAGGSGTLEFEEVKGPHWRDDARAKIKMAAKQFPFFRFRALQRQVSLPQFDGTWVIEEWREG